MAWHAVSRFFLIAVFAIFAASAQAQISDSDREQYQDWLATADRAESAIDAKKASNAAFEKLRSDIAGFRETFISTRNQNGDRIKTLESQIAALGPKPETGDEPSDIADLRARLTQQLNKLRVPGVVAEEAYNRANGLISEIDRIIRDRQKKKLLSRGQSPLTPSLWPTALRDVETALVSLVHETQVKWRTEATQNEVRNRLPAIFVLGLVGLFLLTRSGFWAEHIGDYLRTLGGRGTGVWSFVVSLARIFLPLAGLVAVTQAIMLTDALGLRATVLVERLPYWGAILLYFRWMINQLHSDRPGGPIVVVPANRVAEMRIDVTLLGAMLVLRDANDLFEQIENVSYGTMAVVSFLPVIFTSLILLRIRQIRIDARRDEDKDKEEEHRSGLQKIAPLFRRVALFLGLTSPVLAAAGYTYAADAILYPAVLTLVVISTVLVLQRFFGDVLAWIYGSSDTARDSLVSVLIAFALSLAAVPVLMLVWGARVADLTELWTRFLAGFSIGTTRISPTVFVTFAIIFAVGYMITKLVQGGLRTSLLPKTTLDPGAQNAIVSGLGYVGIFLSALVAVTGAGLDLSSLAIVAGALSVGIGFGLQTIVSNFVSGIILLIERPISKGDWIEVNGLMGYVRDISVRSTRIETFDRTDVIVPNSDLISGTVTNFTRGNTIGRAIVPVGVSYGTDTRKVETILREVAEAHPMVLANPAPSIVFQGFGADSLSFEIRAILRDVNWLLSVKSDLNHEIAKRFTEEGIEIPFAQRDIWLRNPEVLGGQAAVAGDVAPDSEEPA